MELAAGEEWNDKAGSVSVSGLGENQGHGASAAGEGAPDRREERTEMEQSEHVAPILSAVF